MLFKEVWRELLIDEKLNMEAHKKLIPSAIVCALTMANSVHLAEIQDKLHKRARKNRSLLMRKQHWQRVFSLRFTAVRMLFLKRDWDALFLLISVWSDCELSVQVGVSVILGSFHKGSAYTLVQLKCMEIWAWSPAVSMDCNSSLYYRGKNTYV